jgi:hypothetical protein
MQQNSIKTISEQLKNFCSRSFLYYIYSILPSAFHNQLKTITEIYNDRLAGNFYLGVIQL